MKVGFFFDPLEIAAVKLQRALQQITQTRYGLRQIADNFHLGEVNLIHLRGLIVHMDDLCAAFFHKERRLLHHVMAHVDDEIGALNRTVQIVPVRKRRRAHEEL